MSKAYFHYLVKAVLVLLGLIVFLKAPLFAQEITSRLDKNDVYLSDDVIMEIDLVNFENTPEFQFPVSTKLAFSIRNSNLTSSSISIINGVKKETSIQTVQIRITPKEQGNIEVPPIKIISQKKVFTTEPMPIRVLPPPISENVLLKLDYEKKNYFESESVEFTLKWFFRVNVRDYNFFFPLMFDKNWEVGKQGRSSENRYIKINDRDFPADVSQVEINGDPFTLYEIKVKLINKKHGKYSIRAPIVSLLSEQGFDVKRDVFGRQIKVPRRVRLFASARPDSINVKPIPSKGQPNIWAGAIGNRYSLKTVTSVSSAQVGDEIPLTLELTGKGTFGDIDQWWNILKNSSAKNFDWELKKKEVNDDSVILNFYLKPKTIGIKQIPEFKFAYLNNDSGNFVIKKSRPVPIKIEKPQALSSSKIFVPNQPKPVIQETTEINEPKALALILDDEDNWSEYQGIFIYAVSGILSLALFFFVPFGKIKNKYFSATAESNLNFVDQFDAQTSNDKVNQIEIVKLAITALRQASPETAKILDSKAEFIMYSGVSSNEDVRNFLAEVDTLIGERKRST